ncbi:ATP-binding protein [Streptomyces sp. TRM43335]|uniref:ATP-binding protein n=1 Tax=Streptomyces taklimakanensis TaxID=2569853 RepID=A0A6G2BHW3_9ACTN|nr:ATP-binding protein [Streptomyces taklimakanensis]MTE21659.1 ATP-binding protein [Streptomyces taklimakanensis]
MTHSADAVDTVSTTGAGVPLAGDVFAVRFSSTHRGARLARLLTAEQLDAWGVPYGSGPAEAAALVVAELTANAVVHGRVPGRDFEVRLTLDGGVLRIAVSDARGERLPVVTEVAEDGESGRGLHLVTALATAWGTEPRPPSGKTVRVGIPLLDRPATESGKRKR